MERAGRFSLIQIQRGADLLSPLADIDYDVGLIFDLQQPLDIWRTTMKLAFGFIAAMGLMVSVALAADDTFLDPAKAGVDYQIQGEYLGKLGPENDQRWGAQVIALGDGTFRMVALEGGLPGDGWSRGDEQKTADGKLVKGEVEFKTDDAVSVLRDGAIYVTHEGQDVGAMKKVTRESPTLGIKPPSGATILFDGKTADNFVRGAITEEKLLAANCESKLKLGDHRLHIEFRTPFKPKARGQGRGNSGVYIQSRYECQVLDSFGLDGKDNECGGIYQISKPDVNMCFPPLTWQTYDMDFRAARYKDGKKVENARVTIKHNGFVIHENIELPHHTPGKIGEGPDDAPVYLQGHGNPVVFQNIWVVKK
jgi:hypothetical protein